MFSVTATGSGTLSYQWAKNGQAISGATNATYTTPATTLQDSGASFTVVVSNEGGLVTSSAATLTTNADPEGIYTGAFSLSGGGSQPVVAIILKDGTAEVFATLGATGNAPIGFALHGVTVKPSGAQFTSNFTALTQTGIEFTNGQTSLSGSLTGTVTPGQSISGTFTTSLDSGTFTLTAQTADYARSAAGATIAGTYTYVSAYDPGSGTTTFNSTTTYAADGTGTGANGLGCNGSVSYTIPDGTHNAYKVSTDSMCPGPTEVKYSGLAAFFPAGTGASINNNVNFTNDTLFAIVDNTTTAYMIIASK